MASRPNIVELIWHDLGDWLSCCGRPDVPSPNLQRLADEGVVFANNFCTAPQCSPSRASIKTGRYPQSNGMMGLTHRGWSYSAGERDLPELLRDAGYRTFLFGHQHERSAVEDLTYDEHWLESTRALDVAPRVVEFLRSRAAECSPFFASIGFTDVHRNFGTRYDPAMPDELTVPGFLPDVPMVRRDMATFYECIRRSDEGVGMVLDALREAGLEEGTLVYFTTDHGPEFPRAKMTLYDPGLRTAFIEPGTRVDDLVSNVDLLPSLLEAISVAVPENVQGRSFWPRLTGGEYAPRDAIFGEMTWHGGEYDPMRCIRTGRHKYIRNFIPGWPPQMGGGYTQRYGEDFIQEHYGMPRPAEELYDLEADRWELDDLAGRPECEAVRASLASRIEVWMKEAGDPLLDGHVPCPAPEKAGYACLWGRFPTRDPVNQETELRIVRLKEFGEEPI